APQKSSTIHTFTLPLAAHNARRRPSGEGLAQPRGRVFSSSIVLTFPCKSMFSRAHVSLVVYAIAHKLLPSALQSKVPLPAQASTCKTRSAPSGSERSRIARVASGPTFFALASNLPSGERLQLNAYGSLSFILAAAISV